MSSTTVSSAYGSNVCRAATDPLAERLMASRELPQPPPQELFRTAFSFFWPQRTGEDRRISVKVLFCRDTPLRTKIIFGTIPPVTPPDRLRPIVATGIFMSGDCKLLVARLQSATKYDTMQLFSLTGDIKMAQVALSIRMDEDLKRDFGQFCSDIGMSMSTAFVVFAKATLQERQIPFVIGERKAYRRIRQNRLDPAALRAQKAFESIRADVQSRDLPELTMEEIDAEIATARRERRERETTARKAVRA